MSPSDAASLFDVVSAVRTAMRYAQGMTQVEFLRNDVHQDAIIRQLSIAGEAVKRLSSEFRADHSEVAWKDIAGFRDRVIHDYSRVDLNIVWEIIAIHGPALVAAVEPLIPPTD